MRTREYQIPSRIATRTPNVTKAQEALKGVGGEPNARALPRGHSRR